MGKSSPEIKQLAIQRGPAVVLDILGVLEQQLKQQNDVDVDLVRDLAGFVNRTANINLGQLIESDCFEPSLILFTNILETINSAELNENLVKYLCFLIDQVSLKFGRLSQLVQQKFMKNYNLILRALLVTLTKQGMNRELGNIAQSF